jgi:7-carboxy-7-deazaguanine synthase (Cx14CxxC type)
MSYLVKEIYYTLQGEGANAGRPAVFCRFSGCNLWSGREQDRVTAVCRFCDTDFLGTNGPGGGRFDSPADLAAAVRSHWPHDALARAKPLLVCTGGEPLLQLDSSALDAFHAAGFEVAVETNGTKPAPAGIDWICVSPKAGAPLHLRAGDELKLVFPQIGADPALFESLPFKCFFLQPMDGPHQQHNIQLAAQYCLEHPLWRLSLQTHKLIGLP